MAAEVVEFVDPRRRRKNGNAEYERNRKLFMSSRVSDVLKTPSAGKPEEQDSGDDLRLPDFDSIFRGVERVVGNSHLTWKEKKKAEQQRAEALGAKPVKKCRVPIDNGLAHYRKRKKEEELKMKEDLAAGNLVKRTKKAKSFRKLEDRALKATEGKFKGGVLHVKQRSGKNSSFKSRNSKQK